jgi:hypothetical protein
MSERMPRPPRFARDRVAALGEPRPARLERALSWSDFRAAVAFDPANRLLVAVPAISAKRAEHAWLGRALGLYTRIGAGDVYRREFEHGTVYWSERTGAHEVHGAIAERWRESGGESSLLGFPITDERPLAAGASGEVGHGGYAHFENGSIYFTPRHGAAIVIGMVRDIWALLGWERSPLGVPVGDVVFDRETGVLRGCFEHGSIAWSPAGGPVVTVDEHEASGELADREHDTLDRLHGDFAPQG